ncbi:MAG: SDR family oxidoreductase [Myxococcota bacterium]|nr:SDR family oxidoreductase [Myxococcota bacterium]
MRLEDKVILITGASRGIGAACARALAREGAHLSLAAKTMEPHARLPGTLPEVAAEIRALGRDALAVQVDVRHEEQVEAMVARTVEHFGRLDAVVNNAGAIFWAPVSGWPTKRYDLVFAVNVRAAFLTSRAALPHLRERGGHVLMMSPPIHPEACASKAPYLVSKIGMTMLAMAIDEEESNIAAHALWPVTGIRTAATVNLGMGQDHDWRTPEIVADATVELLARDPASCSFRAWLDEEVLTEAGVTDFRPYRCDPDHEPSPMSIQLVDPGWTRS